MRKYLALTMVAAMALGMVACGAKNVVESSNAIVELESTVIAESSEEVVESSDLTDSEATVSDSGALNILNTVWATYGEDEVFAVAGGDSTNMSFDGPAACDPTNSVDLDTLFGFPVAQIDKIDDAASMMHAMNQNTFTAGVYHLVDAADAQALADEMKTNILGRQWMCGFPETLIIVSVDDYVVSAFGHGDVIETFKNKLTAAYEGATVLHETAIE